MRVYERSHPWISFTFDLRKLSHKVWLLLGEAESKCEHIAGVPLRPDAAKRMYEIFLSKGIHGTTSIEGNTLSEDEVLQRVRGDLPLPASREYLGQEIDNILDLYNEIVNRIQAAGPSFPTLCPARLNDINKRILHRLPLRDSVVPGITREHSVGVANYRGAPAEDVDFLVDKLCNWLNGPDFVCDEDNPLRFTLAALRAILAHLYIAWIRPYSDGNGRTARIVEFQILVEAGVPIPAAHLLSDHYNKTRERYYQVLDRTSKREFPVEEFVTYAMEGFVDELREQIEHIRAQQQQVTWENFVHDMFRNQNTTARIRQKHLVLDLPPNGWVPVADLRRLSTRLAEEYAGKGQKTLPRDLNQIQAMGLIERRPREVRAKRTIIEAFLPPRVPQQ